MDYTMNPATPHDAPCIGIGDCAAAFEAWMLLAGADDLIGFLVDPIGERGHCVVCGGVQ